MIEFAIKVLFSDIASFVANAKLPRAFPDVKSSRDLTEERSRDRIKKKKKKMEARKEADTNADDVMPLPN